MFLPSLSYLPLRISSYSYLGVLVQSPRNHKPHAPGKASPLSFPRLPSFSSSGAYRHKGSNSPPDLHRVIYTRFLALQQTPPSIRLRLLGNPESPSAFPQPRSHELDPPGAYLPGGSLSALSDNFFPPTAALLHNECTSSFVHNSSPLNITRHDASHLLPRGLRCG